MTEKKLSPDGWGHPKGWPTQPNQRMTQTTNKKKEDKMVPKIANKRMQKAQQPE